MSKKEKKAVYNAAFEKIIQIGLTDDDVDRIEAWQISGIDRIALCERLSLEGYTIKLLHDDAYGTFSASIFGGDTRCEYAGLMIYGNGETLQDALDSMLFKVTVKLDGLDWRDYDEKPAKSRFR